MASTRRVKVARRNVRRAHVAARRKRAIAKLSAWVRRDLGKQGAVARRRGGKPGHALEDRTRDEIYELAKRRDIPGRSRMGKWDLIKALRRAG